jgi:transposase-like protein
MNEEQVIAAALPGAVQRVEAASIKPKQRRRHSAQFRQQVIEEASRPGVRVASVARAHDLDVGLVRRWIANASARERLHAHARAARQRLKEPGRVPAGLNSAGATPAGSDPAASFLAIAVGGAAATSPSPEIRIQFNRGPTSIGVTWPVSAAADCGQWLREVMR